MKSEGGLPRFGTEAETFLRAGRNPCWRELDDASRGSHPESRRDLLRASARQEYESARYETDPEIINRLLVVGRDAVRQVSEKVRSARSGVEA